MTSFYDTREWKIGDAAQTEWARIVADKGGVVLPTYGMDDVTDETKAPVVFTKDGVLVAPDLAVVRSGKMKWNDVKAKSQPSWYRKLRRWEHGCDYSIACEYNEVQVASGCPVYIIVHELKSPADPDADSELVLSSKWMFVLLDNIFADKNRRRDWPGGKSNPSRRGRKKQGGLIWGRNEMTEFNTKV